MHRNRGAAVANKRTRPNLFSLKTSENTKAKQNCWEIGDFLSRCRLDLGASVETGRYRSFSIGQRPVPTTALAGQKIS